MAWRGPGCYDQDMFKGIPRDRQNSEDGYLVSVEKPFLTKRKPETARSASVGTSSGCAGEKKQS
jgi:hypothetical protein